MIFIDIETTGIDRINCGILSIGAVHFESNKEFYIQCRPNSNSLIDEKALAINGFKKEEIFSPAKISAVDALGEFFRFCNQFDESIILAGYNIGSFDCLFLHRLYDGTFDMTWRFGKRFVDVHSIGHFIFGESLSSDELSLKLGIRPEERPHNALTGAKHAFKLYQVMKSRNPFSSI